MLESTTIAAHDRRRGRWPLALGWAALLLGLAAAPAPDPFLGLDLPDDWEAKFWADPDVKALLELEPAAAAKLVPTQAGLRFCRCPACDAPEADDPLAWSIRKPDVVTCRRCGVSVPNEKIPTKVENKVPTQTVEVLPGVTHKYPYEKVPDDKSRYVDERLYLEAKRDYEAREFLAKAALYAAVRHHEQPEGAKDPALARLSAVLLLRFAQVYPSYALHLDQPGQPKFFEPAQQPPPYRRGYRTGKWDWSGSLNVPLNLVIAYAMIRHDPAIAEAGKTLGDANPARTIERDLFLASAEFSKDQPIENDERALQVDRGLLAVGRLLGDPGLVRVATKRLNAFAEAGFYHDGLWRQGDTNAHRRILGMLDGWIERFLVDPTAAPTQAPTPGRPAPARTTADAVPMLALARAAGASASIAPPLSDVRQAAWPAPTATDTARRPALLGGAGLARLAIGQGDDALDLELRGLGNFGSARSRRQALRLAVGGQAVLDDLDDLPPLADGWDLASASHNTVLIDGLNHRETAAKLREPAAGGNFLYFAADPDFQVAVLDDPRAYPTSATRFRQTVVASSGPRARYAVTVFEVRGGLQHDQVFHAPSGPEARWSVSVPTESGPETLLPPEIPYVTTAKAADNRWFVQGYGEFTDIARGTATKPALASLIGPGRPGVRLHLLGDVPATVMTAMTPRSASEEDARRPALMLRRRSVNGSTLQTTFVTLFEPIRPGIAPMKVGRVAAPAGLVVLYLETADGPEHLVINASPGTPRTVKLADGRELVSDGLVTRLRVEHLAMAGGTEATTSGIALRQPRIAGKVLASARYPSAESRGWFETDAILPGGLDLAGRTLLIRHGDGTTRGWTLVRAEPVAGGRVRLHVREEPGFLIEGEDRLARYYQFPGSRVPGPHTFSVPLIGRGAPSSAVRLTRQKQP